MQQLKATAIVLVVAAVFTLGQAQAQAQIQAPTQITSPPALSANLPNLRIVNEQILRGGRPTLEGLKQLQAAGVKTIIDIENTNSAIKIEMENAKALGLDIRSYQMSALWTPPSAKVNQILADLQNPALAPIYIHCHHGEDRTGFIVGLYRVTVDHWPAQKAYNEMLSYGYHPAYYALTRDFWFLTK